jgi:hypothetical protein
MAFQSGVSSIEYDNTVSFIDSDMTSFLGKVELGYYATDNLLLTLGYENRLEQSYATLGAEYGLPVKGMSLQMCSWALSVVGVL